ncbi:hypothetical protein BDV30DRAFT_240488 [Aspergillus minisclerotigenes]|uniref:HNH nuclease domain-containing protein n=1 Tax=Aspergillus minisclerotigenes TaxID=656917 RepID=A0A5N6J006_9EURO|nr:hypothetical protein BDV30DRAFT_240488 [Aspergillus minisclerotigenes]
MAPNDSKLMPPPQGSPQKKRKMSAISSGNPSSKLTESSSGLFSETARSEIKRFAQWRCFACECSVPPDAAHVIEKHDSAVPRFIERKLLDFSINGIENGVSLCPNCHRMYGKVSTPGFTFFPLDIEFFIRKELEYREQIQSSGSVPTSRVPSSEDYRNFQVLSGRIPSGSAAGLYQRFFLQGYLPPRIAMSADRLLHEPVPWHGAPFGTFRRAFQVLGSPQVVVFPKTIKQQLETLRDLYYGEISTKEVVAPTRGPNTAPESGSGLGPGAGSGAGHPHAHTVSGDRQSSGREGSEWILGPQFTSAGAMQRYGPVIQSASSLKTA